MGHECRERAKGHGRLAARTGRESAATLSAGVHACSRRCSGTDPVALMRPPDKPCNGAVRPLASTLSGADSLGGVLVGGVLTGPPALNMRACHGRVAACPAAALACACLQRPKLLHGVSTCTEGHPAAAFQLPGVCQRVHACMKAGATMGISHHAPRPALPGVSFHPYAVGTHDKRSMPLSLMHASQHVLLCASDRAPLCDRHSNPPLPAARGVLLHARCDVHCGRLYW